MTNWQSKVIIDLVAAFEPPKGFEEAFSTAWHGTVPGCWCGDVDPFLRRLLDINWLLKQGYCDSTTSSIGCYDIKSNEAKHLNVLGQVNNSDTKIFVKRSNDTWFDLMNKRTNTTCAEGTIQCNMFFDDQICFKGSKCPIYEIHSEIVDPNQWEIIESCIQENNCTVLSQTNQRAQLLRFQRGDVSKNSPIAQLKLNEYNMCSSVSQDNITPGREDYLLYRFPRITCNADGQHLWNTTTSIKEDELFRLNKLTPTITSFDHYLGYYSTGHLGSDYEWALYSRGFIPLKTKCHDQKDSLLFSSKKIQSFQNAQFFLSLSIYVTAPFLIFGLPVFLNLLKSVRSEDEYVSNHSAQQTMKYGLILRIIGFLALLCQLPFQVQTMICANEVRGLLTNVVKNQCSSPEYNNLFQQASEKLESLFTFSLSIFIIYFLKSIFICWTFHHHGKNYENIYYNTDSRIYQRTFVQEDF